jgi:hypothetical protein
MHTSRLPYILLCLLPECFLVITERTQHVWVALCESRSLPVVLVAFISLAVSLIFHVVAYHDPSVLLHHVAPKSSEFL